MQLAPPRQNPADCNRAVVLCIVYSSSWAIRAAAYGSAASSSSPGQSCPYALSSEVTISLLFNLCLCPLLCLPQKSKGVAAFISCLTVSVAFLTCPLGRGTCRWDQWVPAASVAVWCWNTRGSAAVCGSARAFQSRIWAAVEGCSSSRALPQRACLSSRWITIDHLQCPFPGCDKIHLRAVVRGIFVAICCYPAL